MTESSMISLTVGRRPGQPPSVWPTGRVVPLWGGRVLAADMGIGGWCGSVGRRHWSLSQAPGTGPDTLGIAAAIRLSLGCDEGLVARDQAPWELSSSLLRLRVMNQWPQMPSAKPPDEAAAPRTERLGDPGWGAGPGARRGCPGSGLETSPPFLQACPCASLPSSVPAAASERPATVL